MCPAKPDSTTTPFQVADIALQVFEASPDMYSVIDLSFQFIYVNPAYMMRHHCTPEDIVGKTVGDIVGTTVYEETVKPRLMKCMKGEAVEYDATFDYPELGPRWMNVRYTPLRDKAGVIYAVVSNLRDITSRYESSDHQQRSIELSRHAARIAGVGHLIWDEVNNVCGECTDVIPAIYGLTPEEFVTKGASAECMLQLAEDDDEWLQEEYDKCSVHGQSYDVKYRIRRKDGAIRWVHEIGEPYRIEEGRIISSIVTMRDITGEVAEHEALERERYFVQQIEQVIGVGLFIWDVGTQRNIYCSDSLSYMHGLTPEDLKDGIIGEDDDIDLALPDDRARVAEAYEKSRLHGEPIDVEYRINHPEKGVRWLHEVAVRRTFGDDGQIVTMGLVHEITGRKKEEEMLRRRDILFSQIEDNFEIGFWYWENEPYGMSYVSDAYCRIHGKSRKEMMEQSSSVENELATIHPDDHVRMQAVFAAAVKNGDPYDQEFRMFRKDGAIRWVHEVSSPLRTHADGTLAASVGVMRDITERREREEELRLAKTHAEQASRAKSDFLAHMSHELRTPLNAVIGFSDAIRFEIYGPLGDERYQEYLDNIQNSGRLLLALINDLLDMAAIEAGELSIDLEPQNMTALVSEMMELASPSARTKDISITLDNGLDQMNLMVDARRFRQIILNLLINAVKYTPNEGAVAISGCINDQGCPTITISDNGVGMTEDEKEAALIPFRQIKDATIRQVEGTGIGLPLTNQLVELHLGTLTIESVKRKGTTVTVTLPLERIVQ